MAHQALHLLLNNHTVINNFGQHYQTESEELYVTKNHQLTSSSSKWFMYQITDEELTIVVVVSRLELLAPDLLLHINIQWYDRRAAAVSRVNLSRVLLHSWQVHYSIIEISNHNLPASVIEVALDLFLATTQNFSSRNTVGPMPSNGSLVICDKVILGI